MINPNNQPKLSMVNFDVLFKAPDVPGYVLRAAHIIRNNKGFLNTGEFFKNMSLQEVQDILNHAETLRNDNTKTQELTPMILFVLVIAHGEGIPGVEEGNVRELLLTLILLATLAKFDKIGLGKAQWDNFELMSLNNKATLFIPATEPDSVPPKNPDNPNEADQPT